MFDEFVKDPWFVMLTSAPLTVGHWAKTVAVKYSVLYYPICLVLYIFFVIFEHSKYDMWLATQSSICHQWIHSRNHVDRLSYQSTNTFFDTPITLTDTLNSHLSQSALVIYTYYSRQWSCDIASRFQQSISTSSKATLFPVLISWLHLLLVNVFTQ